MSEEQQPVPTPRNKVSVKVVFEYAEGQTTKVVLDSTSGCAATITGPLYPAELRMISGIAAVMREEADKFPAHRVNKPKAADRSQE